MVAPVRVRRRAHVRTDARGWRVCSVLVDSGKYSGDKHDMTVAIGSFLEISLSAKWHGQTVMNVYQYRVNAWPTPATGAEVGEAWWNHVSVPYRNLVDVAYGDTFEKVIVREVDDPTGLYGEYAVPPAQRPGTRPTTGSQGMPPFNAVSARLSVATRATRPGQKRFGWINEIDADGPYVNATFRGLVEDILDVMTVSMLLGAPAALVSLEPVVVSKAPVTGFVVAWQEITGYSINASVSSQVSRKIGRGS